ncbi:MAG: hypothetical protein U0Q19_05110 [Kineosporiaceae bacterium]
MPSTEWIVLVEDVGELRPRHPHVVRLEARHANVEGRGEVGLDVLVLPGAADASGPAGGR